MGRLGWAVILGCILGMILFGILQQRGCRADADSAPKVVAQPTTAATPAPTPTTSGPSTPSWTRSGGYSAPPQQASASAAAERATSLRDREYEHYRRMQGTDEAKTPIPQRSQPTILDNGVRRPVSPAATPRSRPRTPTGIALGGVPPVAPVAPQAASADGAPAPQTFVPAAQEFFQPTFTPSSSASRSSSSAPSSAGSASSESGAASPAPGGLGSSSSNDSGAFTVVTGAPQSTNPPPSGATPTPTAFTLAFPANGARDVASPLQLRWNSSTNATAYRVRISTSATFGTLLLDRANLTSVTFTIPDGTLAPGVTYFWSVTASNTTSTTREATSAFSFSTRTSTTPPTGPSAPGAFALTAPANNSRGHTGAITLAWSASPGATSYAVVLARDNAFTQVVTTSTVTQTSLALTGATLDPGATYFWRVEARNSIGQRLVGPASFTTLGKPGAFTLLTPTDNANPAPSPVILTWSPSIDAATYRVEVATDSAFLNRVINRGNLATPTLALLPSELQPGTRYFWRVTASNAIDFTGSSPTSRSFTTRSGPGAFALVSPNADASVGLPVTLQWDPSENALLYRVEVSTSQTFATTVVNQLVVPLVSGTQFTVPEGLLVLGQQYYWRVTASNEGGDRAATGGPRAFRAGVADYDVNNDGLVDVLDMYAYAALSTPTDLNGDGRADAADRTGLRNAARSREPQDILVRN